MTPWGLIRTWGRIRRGKWKHGLPDAAPPDAAAQEQMHRQQLAGERRAYKHIKAEEGR